ncbi:MAG: DUF1016 N-terminal domain-containing protein, partial [Candidatus Omnitrophica bacterium]|nr:DUF1016 N-terminal domain-containing protein [Candidatus Omnitrophota bacterium]
MKFEQLLTLFQETHRELQKRAAQSVDISLVVRNWLFGWYIVEFEKGGADRAEYGSKLLKKLAKRLKIKGCSERGLALYCKFYNNYSEILQTVSAKSEILSEIFNGSTREIGRIVSGQSLVLKADILQALSAELAKGFALGWSHYVTLLTISNPDERRFYEIEAR